MFAQQSLQILST
uniref:Uncharacterized protein n=1 Tax=Arundo donax TaxID=35708 RepID=A0A0A9BRP9_ARUDO